MPLIQVPSYPLTISSRPCFSPIEEQIGPKQTKPPTMKIKFLGATHTVTGSCYLLEDNEHRTLIDCGLHQERHNLNQNWEPFPTPPDQIQNILLTHVHLDHSGLIPKLVKEGFNGNILMTPPSQQLFPIVIKDSAHMQEEDAAYKKKRHEQEGRKGPRPETPLYTTQDAENCLPLVKTIPYEQPTPLNQNLQACFHDAGHILGSAMIEITRQDTNTTQKIIFSGDIGQWNNPLLSNPTVFDQADYVIMESTYANHNHETPQETENKLCNAINQTIKSHGNLLIPTFVIERPQELLYHLNILTQTRRIPNIKTFLDSPMAVEITKIYQQYIPYFQKNNPNLPTAASPFDLPELNLVETIEASKAIDHIKEPKIIMAGSGMITGGRIKHHLIKEITNPQSTLLFVGYQAAGTLGRQIQDGNSPVRILGQNYPVRIKIQTADGLSAHAGMNDLQRWLNNFKTPPKHVFITHGEEDAITSLENFINSKNGWTSSAPTYLEERNL
jgi:metallo-beta-lactamase family protein